MDYDLERGGREVQMHRKLTIEYGDEVLLGTGLTADEFSQEAKLLLAAKLYELGRLTSGQAARLCGMQRMEFLYALKRVGVAMSNLRAEDIESDLQFAQNA